MSLQPKKSTVSNGVQIFQTVLETAQGGFTLDATGIVSETTVPAGTVISFNEATRVAKVIKTAKVVEIAGGSATVYKVAKGSIFQAGDKVGLAIGGDGTTISGVVTTHADYDSVTVAATLGAAAVGDVLFLSTATGEDAAAIDTPNGLLYDDVVSVVGADVAVVLRGTVYENRINSVPAAIKAKLPLIVFSQSF